ncbi:MAG: PilZ domain-containing protein [Pseudolabrys sp.]|jgi:hypothetical protein
MQERRKINRTRVLKGAKFLLKNSSVRDCVVRDLTNAGAGVEVPNTLELPQALDLTFDGGRSLRQCRLVWRNINKTGVEFV